MSSKNVTYYSLWVICGGKKLFNGNEGVKNKSRRSIANFTKGRGLEARDHTITANVEFSRDPPQSLPELQTLVTMTNFRPPICIPARMGDRVPSHRLGH